MPFRFDEIKESQEIAAIAAKTASMVIFKAVTDKVAALEKRLTALEKQSNSPTKQGKEKTHA